MLKFTKFEKKILDALLKKRAKKVAQDLKLKDVQQCYNVKSSLKRKTQNAEEFLAVARGKYGDLLKHRVNTPSIMPEKDEDEHLLFREHNRK